MLDNFLSIQSFGTAKGTWSAYMNLERFGPPLQKNEVYRMLIWLYLMLVCTSSCNSIYSRVFLGVVFPAWMLVYAVFVNFLDETLLFEFWENKLG